MYWVNIVVFVLLSTVFGINGEWVEIPQSAEHISERKLSIDGSMVPSDGFVVKDLNKLKYEELADIIGPGFEDEFSKFLQKHSHEVSAEEGALDGNQSIGSTTENILYVDPWLKYDQGHTTAPFITSTRIWVDSAYKNSSVDYKRIPTATTTIAPTDLHRRKTTTLKTTATISSTLKTKAETHKSEQTSKVTSDKVTPIASNATTTKTSNATNKQILKTKRIKWVPYNPFSFTEVLKFLRSIGNSFSMGTTRGISAKIDMLRKFKAELMQNIGNFTSKYYQMGFTYSSYDSISHKVERLEMLWPSQTEKKKRAKRGMMDGGGGGGHHDVSNEIALMTISILTFAVFLIKLVLVRNRTDV